MTLVWRAVSPGTFYFLTPKALCNAAESHVPAVICLQTSARVGLSLLSLLAPNRLKKKKEACFIFTFKNEVAQVSKSRTWWADVKHAGHVRRTENLFSLGSSADRPSVKPPHISCHLKAPLRRSSSSWGAVGGEGRAFTAQVKENQASCCELEMCSGGLVVLLVLTVLLMDPPVFLVCLYPFVFVVFPLFLQFTAAQQLRYEDLLWLVHH